MLLFGKKSVSSVCPETDKSPARGQKSRAKRSLVNLAFSIDRICRSYMVPCARFTEAFPGDVSLSACGLSSGIEFYHLALGTGRFVECFA